MIFKWIFRATISFILLLTPVVLVAYFYPEKFLCMDSGKASADVIVVLGGGVREFRAERAAELFQQRAAPRIIITGAGDDEINRLILHQKNVPASAIEVEGNSTTTRENAEFTIKMLRAENIRSVILVTSWYHARRALKTFEHFAPELNFYSRPSYYAFARADWRRLKVTHKLELEFLKLPGYWLRHGVNPF